MYIRVRRGFVLYFSREPAISLRENDIRAERRVYIYTHKHTETHIYSSLLAFPFRSILFSLAAAAAARVAQS